MGIGLSEIVVILIVLLIVGPEKLPGLARGAGRSLKRVRDAMRSINEQLRAPDMPITAPRNDRASVDSEDDPGTPHQA